MCNLVHENSVKVCEVRIFNKAICTAFRNGGSIRQLLRLTWKICVGGVAVLLNDMEKLTLSDADLTVLTAFVRNRLVANVCRIMIYGHMHCIDTCPPLSHAHAPSRVRTLLSPPADSHVAPTVYLQVDVTHICALHTLPSELLKTKRRCAHFILAHTSHTYTITLAANVLWA